MLTLWKSRGIFLGWETQRRCGEPTAVELHPAEAPAQKLRHRMSFSLMLIYIALNLAVILTEKHVTKAGQVGFNHQSVTHISFSQVGTKKPKPQKSLSDGETLSSLWRNNCRGGSEGMLPWQLNPTNSFGRKKKKGWGWLTVTETWGESAIFVSHRDTSFMWWSSAGWHIWVKDSSASIRNLN